MLLLPLALTVAVFQTVPEAPLGSERLRAAVPEFAARADTTLHGYEISGRNRRGLREVMQRLRPADLEGQRHDAVVLWRYGFQMRGGPAGCDPARTEVTLAITVVLPDLATPERLPRAERAAWNSYFERLVAHETNHVRIAELGLERMQAAMRAAPDCEAARAAGMAENTAIGEASAEYDRRTSHGRREGVVF